MEDIWEWVSHPYPEEHQVVPRTPEREINYDLTMSLLSTPMSAIEEPFKDEEELCEEEQHGNEIDGVPADSSPYLDSSFHHDCEETHDEDPTDSESSLAIVAPLPSSSLSIHAPRRSIISTTIKSIPI